MFNLLLKYPNFIPFGPLVSPFIWLFRKSKLSKGGPLAVAWHLSPRLHLTRLRLQLWKLKPTSSSSSSSYSTSSSSPSSSSSSLFRPQLSFQREIRLLIACTTACWRAAIAESLTFYFLFEDTLGSLNVSCRYKTEPKGKPHKILLQASSRISSIVVPLCWGCGSWVLQFCCWKHRGWNWEANAFPIAARYIEMLADLFSI